MLIDELTGRVAAVLALDGLSLSRTLELIKSRAGRANPEQTLAAAVALLREQAEQIAELEGEVEELDARNGHLEDDLTSLAVELEALRKGKV
jgi:predicted RNase H-like nuclease (RuvC/YqgF family)